jgi:CheY-like chemotaxis protein
VSEPEAQLPAAPQQAQIRVLIVEDDFDIATSFSRLLRLLGCHAAAAFGTAMGLQMVALFRPHLVLSDLHMPGADGVELVRTIRAIGEPFVQPICVCITGDDSAEEIARCIEAGFDRVEVKPIDAAALGAILELAKARVS